MYNRNAPPRLVMGDSEICVSYRQSLDKRAQVRILADLNASTKERILAILLQNGFADPFAVATVLPTTEVIPPAESAVPPAESAVPPAESAVPPAESAVLPLPPTAPPPTAAGSPAQNSERDAKIRAMIESGTPVVQIAEALGLSATWVYACIRKMGIKPPTTEKISSKQDEPISEPEPPSKPAAPKPTLYARLSVLSKITGERMNDAISAFSEGNDNTGLIRLGELKAVLRDLQNEIYRVSNL